MEFANQESSPEQAPQLETTRIMRQEWFSTARWANFLAIAGFIGTGIVLLVAISLPSIFAQLMSSGIFAEQETAFPFATMGVGFAALVVVSALVQLVLLVMQYRFAANLKRAVQQTDQRHFEQAWFYFRNLYRWTAIITILFIGIYLLGIVVFAAFLS